MRLMSSIRSVPNVLFRGAPQTSRRLSPRGARGPSGNSGLLPALCVGMLILTGCNEAAADPDDSLSVACTEAEQVFADAPVPADDGSREQFLQAAGEATTIVQDAIDDLEDAVDEQALEDMRWQLDNFPHEAGDEDVVLRVAHEASAAIVRIDRFAEALNVTECGAATWRPADWRAMAARVAGEPAEEQFRQQVDQLCAQTFPEPELLASGEPLLSSLVGGAEDDAVTDELLSRLNSLDNRPAAAGRFLRDFSDGLVEIQPSGNLESEYTALVAAFTGIDAVVPRVVPENPSPEFTTRIEAAFEELEQAWSDMDISC